MKLLLLTRLNTKKTEAGCFITTGLLFLIVLTAFSCGERRPAAKVLKETDFNAGVVSGCPGIYYDRELKQQLIYFIDKVEHKAIQFFDVSGKLIRTTPLAKVHKALDNIAGIAISSADTIIINSNYTNEIAFVDRYGNIWKTIKLKNGLTDSLGNEYELISSTYPVIQDPQHLVYGLSWRNNKNDTTANAALRSPTEQLNYFNRKSLESAYFLEITRALSNAPKLTFSHYGLLASSLSSNGLIAELPSFFLFKDQILVTSFYSDKILRINKKNGHLDGISLRSELTTLSTPPLQITPSIIGKIQDSITFQQKTRGRIERIFYDPAKKEFYTIVRHSATVKVFDQDLVPFSVLTLNKNLQTTAENVFDGTAYKYYYTLLSSNGLLMFKNDTATGITKNKKITYALLNLH